MTDSSFRPSAATSVQGYLFSRPVPVEQVNELISEFAKRRSAPLKIAE